MRCVPVYIVVDVGGAAGQQIVDFVGPVIDSLFRRISADPMLDERLSLAVWEFADEVSVLTPLVHLTDVAKIPRPRAGGESGYSTMFRRLKEHIDADVTRLRDQGLPVVRPCVLLFTTGKPCDTDWRTEHRLLVGEQNPFIRFYWCSVHPGREPMSSSRWRVRVSHFCGEVLNQRN